MFWDAYATEKTTPYGFKLAHHSKEFVAIRFELEFELNLMYPIMRFLLGFYIFSFHMTLDLILPIFYFLLLYVINLCCRFSPSLCSGFKIHSSGLVTKTIHMCLGSTKGFFKKFVINMWNWMFVRTSSISRAESICCISFAVFVLFMYIRPHFDSLTTTGESGSAGIVMTFAAQIAARSIWSYIFALHGTNRWSHCLQYLFPV